MHVRSAFARRALFQLHLWLGLSTGLYLFVVCVSGSALVFRIEFQKAMHPDLFTASSDGPPLDAATIMERVREAFPEDRLSGVDAPTDVRPTYLAYVTRGSRFLTILVDPVTGRVLGELPERSWIRTLQELHFNLLSGRTGRIVNGAGAIVLLLMCVTGLVIWWPGIANWRRAITVDVRRPWRRVIWDLHGATGFWAVTLMAMWAVTGLSFAFPSWFRHTVNAISPVTVARAPRSNPAGHSGPSPPWRALIARAEAQRPGQFVARIVVPYDDTASFHVLFSGTRPTPAGTSMLESIHLDQFTGAVLREPARTRSAGDAVMAWMAPLHIGNFGGPGIRSLWALFGLAPPLLFATGFVLWWTRVVQPRRTYSAGRS